jgi:hypothetical protein
MCEYLSRACIHHRDCQAYVQECTCLFNLTHYRLTSTINLSVFNLRFSAMENATETSSSVTNTGHASPHGAADDHPSSSTAQVIQNRRSDLFQRCYEFLDKIKVSEYQIKAFVASESWLPTPSRRATLGNILVHLSPFTTH